MDHLVLISEVSQSSLPLIFCRYGPDISWRGDKEWQKPFRYATIHFQDRRSAALISSVALFFRAYLRKIYVRK